MVTVGVDGVCIGHWTDSAASTGCTAILLPEGAVASRDVRGGAPATRDLDCLAPDKAVTHLDAVLLTGGSAFGLAAADGVMRFLEQSGRGVATPAGPVPIVAAMALFDLAVGRADIRPNAAAGYAAATAAQPGSVEVGQIGAGTGAYTSHWRGPDRRRPGGIRYAQRRLGDLIVGALCAVNAYGDVDLDSSGDDLESVAALSGPFDYTPTRTQTTIGVVLTNARLDKTGCHVVAQGAHDGLARAITPPHTRFDGDAFITAATGHIEAHPDTVRLMALLVVTDAIRSAASAP